LQTLGFETTKTVHKAHMGDVSEERWQLNYSPLETKLGLDAGFELHNDWLGNDGHNQKKAKTYSPASVTILFGGFEKWTHKFLDWLITKVKTYELGSVKLDVNDIITDPAK
jgi:hypothetical protein